MANGHAQNGNICQDVGHSIADERSLEVDATPGHSRKPSFLYWIALEDTDAIDGDDPAHGHEPQDVCADCEASGGKDAHVHQEQR